MFTCLKVFKYYTFLPFLDIDSISIIDHTSPFQDTLDMIHTLVLVCRLFFLSSIPLQVLFLCCKQRRSSRSCRYQTTMYLKIIITSPLILSPGIENTSNCLRTCLFSGGKCLPSKSPSMHRIHPNKCRSPRIWPTLKRHRPKLTKKNILKNKLSARIRFTQKSLPEFILPSKICERRSRRSRFSQ